jgi:hypothetical protein
MVFGLCRWAEAMSDAREVKELLRARVTELAHFLYPNGKREGAHCALVASTANQVSLSKPASQDRARIVFDCPDDAQVAGMRLRLASNFLTIPASSPCVFFENWTRSQAMWQSQHLPLPRGSF